MYIIEYIKSFFVIPIKIIKYLFNVNASNKTAKNNIIIADNILISRYCVELIVKTPFLVFIQLLYYYIY